MWHTTNLAMPIPELVSYCLILENRCKTIFFFFEKAEFFFKLIYNNIVYKHYLEKKNIFFEKLKTSFSQPHIQTHYSYARAEVYKHVRD